MSLRLDKGSVYTAAKKRSGTSASGKQWELIIAEEGKCQIALWVNNIPSNVEENSEFRIDDIQSIGCKWVARKDDRNKWELNVSANVTVTPMRLGTSFEDLGVGDCPFDTETSIANIDMPDWMRGLEEDPNNVLPD